MMKKLLVLLVLSVLSLGAIAQSKTVADLREKYKDDTDVKFIELNGGIFKLLSSLAVVDENDQDIQTFARIAEGIQSLEMITLPADKKGFDQEGVERLRQNLEKENYNELLNITEGGRRIYLMAQSGHEDSEIKNMLVLIREKSEFLVMDIQGSLNMKDLAYLAKNHQNWN